MIQQEMLQYQSLDGELNRIERELRKNENYIKRRQYKALRQECEDNLTKLDAKAAELRSQLAVAKQSLAEISEVIDEHSREIADIADGDELNYMNRKLSEQLDQLSQVEKDIKRILHDGEELARMIEDINAKLPKIVAGYNKFNTEFAKATEEVKPKVTELKTKQAELKKAIDPDLFAVYKRISDGQIHPVFVPLRDECRCGGCQMEMPRSQVEAQLREKDYMVCEHCGRIIYKA